MWERPVNRKLVAGVASGISEGMGIAKIWVRAAFVILAFAAGVGFILYGIGWLVMPRQGAVDSIADRIVDRANEPKEWVSIGLVTLGVLLLAGNLDLISSDVIFAGGLIAIGLVLYTNNVRDDTEPSPSGGSPPDVTTSPDPGEDTGEEPASLDDDAPVEAGASSSFVDTNPDQVVQHNVVPAGSVSESVGVGAAVADRPTKQHTARSERRRRRRSVLPRLTLGALLLALGAMGMYHASGGFVKDVDYVAAALGIVGFGILVSSVWGRARWLVPIGILLMPVVLIVNLMQVSIIGRWGNFSEEVQDVGSLNESYRYGGGDVTVQLSDALWASLKSDVSADVALGMGSLTLFIPAGVNIVVASDIGLGTFETRRFSVDVPGATYSTGDIDIGHPYSEHVSVRVVAGGQQIYRQAGFPGPTLTLNVDLGLGNVSIYQTDTSEKDKQVGDE